MYVPVLAVYSVQVPTCVPDYTRAVFYDLLIKLFR